jgi:hypothetical protein
MFGGVGRALGATRNVASRARSTGGRAVQGVSSFGAVAGSLGSGYTKKGRNI